MENTFKEILAKILRRFLDDIIFIELKEGHALNLQGVQNPDKIMLPVYISELANRIKSNDIDNIPAIAIIKGLVYVIGADTKLDVRNYYISLLKSIDVNIVISILSDGIRYAEEKQYANAILYFNAALNIDENNLDAYYNLGRSFEDLSEVDERPELKKLGKYCYEQCLKINPDFAYAHFSLGFSLYNEENYRLAEKHWLTALKYELPESMKEELVMGLGRVKDKASYERGYELILANRVDEGLEILLTLEEMHDEWWELLFFIGVGYRMLEQYEDALNYLLKVMNLNTGHIQTMNEIGICLLSLGDYDEAEKYYKEATRLSPENSELICNLGIVYYNKGDEIKARELFDRASQISPEDEVIQMWINHINSKMM